MTPSYYFGAQYSNPALKNNPKIAHQKFVSRTIFTVVNPNPSAPLRLATPHIATALLLQWVPIFHKMD